MRQLFTEWSAVSRAIRTADHVFLLSDFDGTLSPIVDRPELAILPQDTRDLLRMLLQRDGYTVGVVSGRGLQDLKMRVALDQMVYSGNHGLEVEGPGIHFVHSAVQQVSSLMARLAERLVSESLELEGVIVENKGPSISVHYRQVPFEKIEHVYTAFRKVTRCAESEGVVRLTLGKKVMEVRPAVDWGKGEAIDLVLDRCAPPGKHTLPIFLGDDLTDEDGFKSVQVRGGLAISVGKIDWVTNAQYYLQSTEHVKVFLRHLVGRG
jgi:trehalose 6-phosphate phosphatase